MSAVAEAELWFSQGVAARGVVGIVLDDHLLPYLRRRLARRPPSDLASLAAVRRMLAARRDEEHAPQFIHIEEEITAIALGEEDPAAQAEPHFTQALDVLCSDDSLGRQVAMWAARALRRLPSEALSGSSGAWLLAQAASARLGGAPIMNLEPDETGEPDETDEPEEHEDADADDAEIGGGGAVGIKPPGNDVVQLSMQLMPAGHPRIDIGVRLAGRYVELSEPPADDAHRLTAPLADPILVEIRLGGPPRPGTGEPPRDGKTLVLRRGSSTRFQLLGAAWLRTAGGSWHTIEPLGPLPHSPRPGSETSPAAPEAGRPGVRGTGARRSPVTNPYVGLRPYRIEDRDLFFGRDEQASQLRALWLSQRLVVVHGEPGVGKTSLLHAGVLPRFDADEADILPVGRVIGGSDSPGPSSPPPTSPPTSPSPPTSVSHPARVPHSAPFPPSAMSPTHGAPVPERNVYTAALLSSWSPDPVPPEMSIADFLRSRPRRRNARGAELPVLAAVDQFEQLFSSFAVRGAHQDPAADRFIGELAGAANAIPRLRLLLVIRGDSLARLLPYEAALGLGRRTRFRVGPLNREAALDAVTRPLRGTARSFGAGVAEGLVDDLRTIRIVNIAGQAYDVMTDSVDPTGLQLVCSALWRALPDPVEVISRDRLPDGGTIESWLSGWCAAMVSEVAAELHMREADLWEWLERVFVTERGTRSMVHEGITSTGGLPTSVAEAFAQRHVLRAHFRDGGRWYELVHDRLVDPISGAPPVSPAAPPGAPFGEPHGARPTSPEPAAPAESVHLAQDALDRGDLGAAVAHATDALHAGGDDTRVMAAARLVLGRVAAERGSAAPGERHYRAAIELFAAVGDRSAVARVRGHLGHLLLGQGRHTAAADELQAAVSHLPGDVDLQLELARDLWQVGQPQAANAVLSQVLTIAPATVDALILRGMVNAEAGDAASALYDLDNAVRLQPEAAEATEVVRARAQARARLGR
jgi:tetratricopeptide (TPR) repeat protein